MCIRDRNEDTADIYRYMMVGYKLENTLTENGHVARGVCVTDEEGHLLKINERTHIEKHDGGTAYTEDDGKTWTMLPEGSTVSMNTVSYTHLYSEMVGSNVWPAGQNTELALGTAAMYLNGS